MNKYDLARGRNRESQAADMGEHEHEEIEESLGKKVVLFPEEQRRPRISDHFIATVGWRQG